MNTSPRVLLVASLAVSAFACGAEPGVADSELTAAAAVAPDAKLLGYTLRSAHTADLCLHVVNGSSDVDAQIDIESCDNPQADHSLIWNLDLRKSSGGFYRIHNYHSDKCLSLPVAVNHVLVLQTTCNDDDETQHWIQLGGDFGGHAYENLSVSDAASFRCLHTRDSSATSGARVEVADCSSTDHAQDWIGTKVFQ